MYCVTGEMTKILQIQSSKIWDRFDVVLRRGAKEDTRQQNFIKLI